MAKAKKTNESMFGFVPTKMQVRVTFTEEVLGTAPNDKEIYAEYIASKSPDAVSLKEEVAAVGTDEVIEKGTTVFPKSEDGKPFMYDYHWKGFFKEKCSFLRQVKGSLSSEVKAFKKKIDGMIFIEERCVWLNLPEGQTIGNCQRSLRANTPQGERVALACSETVPAGTSCEFTVICMNAGDMELVREWLNFGKFHGTGQWRNSSKGRFVWDEIDENGEIIGGNNNK